MISFGIAADWAHFFIRKGVAALTVLYVHPGIGDCIGKLLHLFLWYNRRNTDKNTLAHAEITAINRASKVIGDWRLEDCTLYVTLEPCQMCAGAIVQARIPKVVMASMNPKAGCAGSILNILDMPQFNHQVEVIQGVLDEECSRMLKEFFVELRVRNKQEKLAKMQQENAAGVSVENSN